MADRTERQLREELAEINADDHDSTEFGVPAGDLSVEWRDADPDARPDGMEWSAETGTVYYDVWNAQQEALNALNEDDEEIDIVAFLAGYGTGKSVAGARWLVGQALAHPGGHFLAMGQSFSEARESTFKKLFGQLPGENTTTRTSSYNGPETSPIVADYNRSEHRVTLVNDSVITLGSADKWSRFAGSEFGAVWLDEPSHYGSDLHDLVEMIGSRLRGVEGPKRQFWTLTGNGYNDAYQILEQRQDANGEPLGLFIELIRAATLENPYLDEADKERFKRQYANTGREEQALRGGFAAAQGLVYSGFSRDTHAIPAREAHEITEDTDPDDDNVRWTVYGYDAGWNDPRVLLEVGRTPYGQLIVLDEFHRSESHVEDVVGWLHENDKPRGPIFAEHEPSDIKKFKRANWPSTKADKSIEAGVSEVRHRLGDDADGRPGLLVSERCQNLIQEFLSYKEDDVGGSSATDHCLDALRYLCMGVSNKKLDERDGLVRGGRGRPGQGSSSGRESTRSRSPFTDGDKGSGIRTF